MASGNRCRNGVLKRGRLALGYSAAQMRHSAWEASPDSESKKRLENNKNNEHLKSIHFFQAL